MKNFLLTTIVMIVCLFQMNSIYSQCTNTELFPSTPVGINLAGTSVTISTCQFDDEYSIISGAVSGQALTFTSTTPSGEITVRSGSPSGPLVAFGVTPLSFINTVTGKLYVHWNLPACGIAATCRTTTVQCTSCTPPPPPSNNDCAGVISLSVNADLNCGITTEASTWSATQSTETAPSCSPSGVDDDVWFSFVAQNVAHQVRIFDASSASAIAVYSGTCGALTQLTSACASTSTGVANLNLTGLSIGTTYTVRVYTTSAVAGTFSYFTMCIGTPPPPPTNDNCPGANALTVNADLNCSVSTAGTTQSATQSTETASTCTTTGSNDDVWYTFVAQNTAHQVRITGATNTTAAAVYSGSCGALTHIACASTTSGTGNVNLTGLTVGTTYSVRVYSTSTVVGTITAFTICIGTPPPPPANDNCAGATALTVNTDLNCGTNTVGTTLSATQSTETASTCSATGSNDDVWYTFVAQNAAHQVRITGATNTTAAAVYSGSCGALTHIACASTTSGTANVNLTGLTVGTTYSVRVYSTSTVVGTITDFIICVGTPPPPPANDECVNAIQLVVNPDLNCGTVTPGTITSATGTADATCLGTEDDDVWFKFTATATSHTIDLLNVTGSVTDMVHQVLSACGGTSLYCSDANSSTASGLTIGSEYLVRVYTWTATTNQNTVFNVCVGTPPPPPSNDDCANAITISGCQSVAGYTISGTGDGLTTTCGTTVSATLQGVWYRFVGDGNPVEVNTCAPSTNFDSKIQVLSGACGTFTCVGGNDDSSPVDPACDLGGLNRKSKVNWVSTLGVTYYIYVYPISNPGGFFTLNLISGPPCPAPTPVSSNISTTSASVSWAAAAGAVSYSYSYGSGVHTCGTGAVVQAGTSVNLTNLIPNTNYTFCVRTNCSCGSSTYSTVSFMTAPLPNDACAGAIPLACNSTVNGSTIGAQSDNTMGICSTGTGGTPGNGVWHSLAGDGSQITLDLCGSAYDTKIHVYSGTCGSLTCVSSNDDNAAICGGGSTRSQVVFNTTPGATYYILVSGVGTTTGAYSLNVGCVCGAPLSFPWSNNAIGAGTVGEGIDNVCGGSIDISSNGYSPTLTSDALFFSSQSLCGNQSITVKVQSITNGGFAGIMFRDTISAGSRFVAIKTQLNPHVFREIRSVANGNRLFQQVPAPGHTWLRLTRSGNLFTGYTSQNGTVWSQAFSVTLALNNCVRVGLFAQGLNPASTAQAQFAMVTGFQAQVITLPNMINSINEGIQGLTVFPNPASSELNLKIGAEYLGKNISINVMDQMGRVVLQRNIPELQTQQEQINVSNLPGGLYIISLMTEGQAAQIQKFIVSGNRP
jgi:hypothetical protein